MIQWIVAVLMVLAGLVASIFIARESLGFPIVQMTIAILIFAMIVFIMAFCPDWIKRFRRKKK